MSDRKLGRSTKTIVAYFALAFCAAGCPSTAPAPNEGKTTRSPDAPVAKAGEQVPSGKAPSATLARGRSFGQRAPGPCPFQPRGKERRVAKPSAEGGSPESIRSPWGNYVQSDSLVEMLREKGELPTPPNPPGWEDYRDRPVESIVREGRVQFPVVHRLYRAGVLSREPSRRELLVRQITEEIESRKGAVAARINGLIGLIHWIRRRGDGSNPAAKSLMVRAPSWDANFYAGTLFFRHGKYAEAVRYLEAAHRIQPGSGAACGSRLRKTRPGRLHTTLVQFGTHTGPGANLQEVSSWPFVNRAEVGHDSLAACWSLALEDYNNDTWVDFVGGGSRFRICIGIVPTRDRCSRKFQHLPRLAMFPPDASPPTLITTGSAISS